MSKPGIRSKRPPRPKAKSIAKAIEADRGRRTKKKRLAKLESAGLKLNKKEFLRPEKGVVHAVPDLPPEVPEPAAEPTAEEKPMDELAKVRHELEEVKATLARKTTKVCALEEELRDLKKNGPPPPSCPIPVKDETRVEVPRPKFDLGAAVATISSMINWAETQSGQDAPESIGSLTDWLVEVVDCI